MKKNTILLFVFASLLSASALQAQVKKGKQKATTSSSLFSKNFCSTETMLRTGVNKDTSNTRALAENYYLWDNGKELVVKFLGNGGSAKLREKIMNAAKEWEKYANLTFKFVEDGPANIRVLLTDNGGCNSAVGTIAAYKPEEEKTMNIDTNFFYVKGICYDNYLRQTIQHEFGHAIGLLHEHYYANQIPWNKEVVYRECEKLGWNKEQVDFQIFQQYSGIYTNGFGYDKYSIMHYPFAANWTTNNIEIKPNFYISETDKKTVGYLYPKVGNRTDEFPRFILNNQSPTKVVYNSQRKGLLIYPSFNLSTSGNLGSFYLVAYLITQDNKGVISPSNPNNYVAAIKGYDLQPGTKVSLNKTTQNFEMFIPASEIPADLKTYKIFFQAILIDSKHNNEKKYLASDVVPFNQIKMQ